MASLNKCSFIGNLARDPDTKYLPSGDAVAAITIGVSESWKDKATGEKKELTEWVRITFFGKLAEIASQYLKKGSQVYVEGSLRTRKYTDKDGVEKYATDIKADTMQMLGSRPSAGGGASMDEYGSAPAPARPSPEPAPRQASRPAPNFSDMDDDIKF